jgi:ribonucleoside-diphosphate reductase beta chain
VSAAAGSDPVLELLAGDRSDARGLYYLWEQQQWEAGKIDLAVDATQWDGLEPGLKRPVADSVSWRRLRAQIATDALVPFVDAAPSEEQQVFLTTRLVDEARHLVFFDRIRAEVFHDERDIEERTGTVDDESLRRLLVDMFPVASTRLHRQGAGGHALVQAEVVYGIAIAGALGLTEQEALVGFLQEEDVLPGLRRGLQREAIAARSTVVFSLGFLSASLARDEGAGAAMAQTLVETLPCVRSSLAALGDSSPTPYGSAQLVAHAEAALERWFTAAGLPLPVRD